MKLRKEFIAHDTKDESLLVPAGGAGFSGLVKGNATFGAIVSLLKDDISREEIIAAMLSRFDAGEEVIAADVDKVLSALRQIGAIDE